MTTDSQGARAARHRRLSNIANGHTSRRMTRIGRVTLFFMTVLLAIACDDSQGPPVIDQAVLPDSAEQMAFGVDFNLTDAGIRKAAVRADTLLFYEDNTREELRKVTARFFTPEGVQQAVLTSNQGTHSTRLGTMEARGSVLVVSNEGKRLESQHLKFDPSRNEISSDSAFTLTEPDGRITKGVGFISNPDMTNMRILAGAQITGTEVKIPRK